MLCCKLQVTSCYTFLNNPRRCSGQWSTILPSSSSCQSGTLSPSSVRYRTSRSWLPNLYFFGRDTLMLVQVVNRVYFSFKLSPTTFGGPYLHGFASNIVVKESFGGCPCCIATVYSSSIHFHVLILLQGVVQHDL